MNEEYWMQMGIDPSMFYGNMDMGNYSYPEYAPQDFGYPEQNWSPMDNAAYLDQMWQESMAQNQAQADPSFSQVQADPSLGAVSDFQGDYGLGPMDAPMGMPARTINGTPTIYSDGVSPETAARLDAITKGMSPEDGAYIRDLVNRSPQTLTLGRYGTGPAIFPSQEVQNYLKGTAPAEDRATYANSLRQYQDGKTATLPQIPLDAPRAEVPKTETAVAQIPPPDPRTNPAAQAAIKPMSYQYLNEGPYSGYIPPTPTSIPATKSTPADAQKEFTFDVDFSNPALVKALSDQGYSTEQIALLAQAQQAQKEQTRQQEAQKKYDTELATFQKELAKNKGNRGGAAAALAPGMQDWYVNRSDTKQTYGLPGGGTLSGTDEEYNFVTPTGGTARIVRNRDKELAQTQYDEALTNQIKQENKNKRGKKAQQYTDKAIQEVLKTMKDSPRGQSFQNEQELAALVDTGTADPFQKQLMQEVRNERRRREDAAQGSDLPLGPSTDFRPFNMNTFTNLNQQQLGNGDFVLNDTRTGWRRNTAGLPDTQPKAAPGMILADNTPPLDLPSNPRDWRSTAPVSPETQQARDRVASLPLPKLPDDQILSNMDMDNAWADQDAYRRAENKWLGRMDTQAKNDRLIAGEQNQQRRTALAQQKGNLINALRREGREMEAAVVEASLNQDLGYSEYQRYDPYYNAIWA